jgi:hypothetical protein
MADWVGRYRASGLGLRTFAEQHGLSESRLHYWVYGKRQGRLARPAASAPLFQELNLTGGLALANWAAEINLSSGLAVRFSAAAAPAWIGEVVEQLRRPC